MGKPRIASEIAAELDEQVRARAAEFYQTQFELFKTKFPNGHDEFRAHAFLEIIRMACARHSGPIVDSIQAAGYGSRELDRILEP